MPNLSPISPAVSPSDPSGTSKRKTANRDSCASADRVSIADCSSTFHVLMKSSMEVNPF